MLLKAKYFQSNQQNQGKGHPSDLFYRAKVSYLWSLTILNPKQMRQWFPIALSQVKADNISENLLNLWNPSYHKFFVSIKRNY